MKKLLFIVLMIISFNSLSQFTAVHTTESDMSGKKISEHWGKYNVDINNEYGAIETDIIISNYCGKELYLTATGFDNGIKYDSQKRPYLFNCTSTGGFKYDVKIDYNTDIMKITDYKRNRIVKIKVIM